MTLLPSYPPGLLEKIRTRFPKADPLARLPDVAPERIPRHVAIIMDGNGRWARERGFPREFGHRNGAAAIRAVLTECEFLGVEMLTLYSFSLENWRRPEREVDFLMQLATTYFDGERRALREKNIRCVVIGRREGLPSEVLASIDRTVDETSGCTGPTLCLALNYGSRAEIADAAKSLARDAVAGKIDPEAIDETVFASRLYTAKFPDPDLLIRTGGDSRVSNYLLWQISYAEIHVTDVLWPDFDAAHLHTAIRDFASRSRRFGGVEAT